MDTTGQVRGREACKEAVSDEQAREDGDGDGAGSGE